MANTGSVRVEGRGQRVDYVEHVKFTSHTLRIRLHDDMYEDQAYAIVERWDGSKWHEVVAVRGAAMKIEHGVGYRTLSDAELIRLFRPDRDKLFALAQEVLG